MSFLRRAGMWFGGALLFFGLFSFITLFSLNVSGVLSPHYFNSALSQIVNASTSSSIYSAGQSINSTQAAQLETLLGTFQANNPNCNVLCLISQHIEHQTGLSAPLTTSNLNLYQIILEIVAVLGAVLTIFSYKDTYAKFSALGKSSLAVAIISFVAIYIPLMFIVPYLFSGVKIESFTLHIPLSVIAPFTSVVLSLDIIFGIVGVVLLIIGAIFLAIKRRNTPKQPPPMQFQPQK